MLVDVEVVDVVVVVVVDVVEAVLEVATPTAAPVGPKSNDVTA